MKNFMITVAVGLITVGLSMPVMAEPPKVRGELYRVDSNFAKLWKTKDGHYFTRHRELYCNIPKGELVWMGKGLRDKSKITELGGKVWWKRKVVWVKHVNSQASDDDWRDARTRVPCTGYKRNGWIDDGDRESALILIDEYPDRSNYTVHR